MTATIDFNSPDLSAEHDADVIVVSCSDFRLRERGSEFISQCYGKADMIVNPGGPHVLLRDEISGEMISYIKTLSGLHQTKHLVLIYHLGCGALKLFCAANADNERAIIDEQIGQLREMAAEQLPEFSIDFVIVDPAFNVVFEQRAEFASA